jgi:hypothetical protein
VLAVAPPAHAQQRDSLVNGAAIGGAIGAGVGVAFTHAVRDSDLVFSQYARSALIFGALGAGIGIGLDAIIGRDSTRTAAAPSRVTIGPAFGRKARGAFVAWRW